MASLRRSMCRVPEFALVGLLACAASFAAYAEQVVCHYTYGGEVRQLVATPVSSPYAVKSIAVGSYFRLRIVFRDTPADIAAIKIYTYADRDEGEVLIHQAVFPYPPPAHDDAQYGFSGLHVVNEPARDGELQYWCALANKDQHVSAGRPAGRPAK